MTDAVVNDSTIPLTLSGKNVSLDANISKLSDLSNVSNIIDNFGLNKEVILQPLILVLNVVSPLISVMVVAVNLVSIIVLMRCKRMPFQTRNISISFMLSDALGGLVLILIQVVIHGFGISTELMITLRTCLVGVFQAVSWCSVAALSIDRAVALKANLRYAMLVTRTTIIKVIISIWACWLFLLPLVIVAGIVQACDEDSTCSAWTGTQAARSTITVLMVVVGAVVVVSNAYVHKVARHHERQIAKTNTSKGNHTNPESRISERQFSATKAVATIVLMYSILHTPMVANHLVLGFYQNVRDSAPRRFYNFVAYTLIQVNTFINLSLYAGKFKEYKMQLYLLLGKCCKPYDRRAQRLRVDVYNIVVSNESRKSSANAPSSQKQP